MSDELINILLVEDNPADIELTRNAFDECKIYNKLFVATDGEEALDFVYKRNNFTSVPRPDLIMLDLNLPKLNGKEVLAVLKEDENLKKIPVVILTSSVAESDIVKSYNLNANAYVTKPVDVNKFLEVVRTIEDFWLGIVKLPLEKNHH